MFETSVVERFMAKVLTGPECWEWQATLSTKGYGLFRVISREGMRGAHRVSYEMFVGPIPHGLVLDHLCRNRKCVRPTHLEPVTQTENVARGDTGIVNRSKIRCKWGHIFDYENTYHPPGNPTKRVCRTCTGLRPTSKSRRLK